jgi:uncharacterized protein (DUF1800 family)
MTGLVRVRRWLLAAMLLTGFCVGLVPLPAVALSYEEARHFALRTGDAALPNGIERLLPLTRTQAVDLVLSGLRNQSVLPPPAWFRDARLNTATMTPEERTAYASLRAAQQRELVSWWYLEMLSTPSPLTERLVFFWHNHFTSSQSKVNSAQMMYRQNALFRDAGTYDFGALLRGIVRDPAMLVYLDNNRNIARAPNENLARELMELFTLGIGNYTEEDVRQVARALTGYTVNATTDAFLYDSRNHDNGQKTILGRTGNFDGDNVAQILLTHPKTAELIVGKLWREFVSTTPNPAERTRLAGVFASSGFQMRPLLRALFLSEAFWAPANRAGLIKHPHEFTVHIARQLALPLRESVNLPGQGVSMGLDLLNPPTVKGWPGHFAWISTMTLPVRQRYITTATTIYRNEVAPALYGTTAARLPTVDAAMLARLNAQYLSAAPTYTQPAAPLPLITALQSVMLDAAFQTK